MRLHWSFRMSDQAAHRPEPIIPPHAAPLRTLIAVGRGEVKPQHRELIELAYAYDATLNALIAIVDALE